MRNTCTHQQPPSPSMSDITILVFHLPNSEVSMREGGEGVFKMIHQLIKVNIRQYRLYMC